MEALQPAAKMLVELSKSQDSAPVTASPPSSSSLALSSPMGFTLQSFLMLSRQSMSSPPWPSPSSSAIASLSSSPLPLLSTARLLVYSSLLAPLAVDPAKPNIVDLRDIKIVKTLGGTVDDTELVKYLVSRVLTRMENAIIVVIFRRRKPISKSLFRIMRKCIGY
ncbi:hypothetical protein ACB098_03G090600 [Castanea mollissima]